MSTGLLKKLAQGLYHAPKQSNLGPLPPTDEQVVRGFLRDKDFLVFSPSSYNMVGLGTTQLYNSTLVYNHLATFGKSPDGHPNAVSARTCAFGCLATITMADPRLTPSKAKRNLLALGQPPAIKACWQPPNR